MNLYLGLQFDSIDLSVCFYANTMLFKNYFSSVLELEFRDINTSRSSSIVQDCFNYSAFFDFPSEIDYCSFRVYKELCLDFNGDYTESVDCFW